MINEVGIIFLWYSCWLHECHKTFTLGVILERLNVIEEVLIDLNDITFNHTPYLMNCIIRERDLSKYSIVIDLDGSL